MDVVLKGLFLPVYWVGAAAWWLITDLTPRALKWMKGHKEAGSLGSSEFADDKKLERAGRLAANGMLAMVTKSKKRVYSDREASLITIGQKGLGKTQSMIAMIRAIKDIAPRPINVHGAKVSKKIQPDLVIYDPKTGVLNATRAELEAMGYKVMVIDIRDPEKSEYLYDPLSILDPHDRFDYDRQIEAMVQLVSPETRHGKHEHFDEWPRILISGIVKHQQTKPELVSLPSCVEKLISSPKTRDALFKEMGFSRDPIVQGAVEAYMSAGDREKGSFITTNYQKMKFWLRPSVRWITEGSGTGTEEDRKKLGWTWESIFDDPQPVAVFVVGGLGTEEGNLVRLIIGNAVNSARRRFNQERPREKPLWVLIDECHTLGNCEAIMNVNRELREAGVNVAMWWLDYEDGEKIYPDWRTLLGGCDLIAYGDSNDVKWYEYIEKLLGKTLIHTRSENESDHSRGKGRHEAQTSLMSASEQAELPFEECVGIFRSRKGKMKVHGRKPFFIKNDQVRFY